jgi:tetratricopeptide (TPR) repeat protein
LASVIATRQHRLGGKWDPRGTTETPEASGPHRGNAYLIKDDYDRAIADYNKAIELRPKRAGVYSNRGRAYEKKGDNARAIADYNKLLELDPDIQSAKDGLKRLGASP